ncbi:hypothetical protein F2Q70_00002242 [Brassica cretica]|uniref:Uncharacterized protein n=1 Tax=Brassica cretica TaxID=69181 RepID=A0A8S9IU53_BRACR|nr:hypothetical protein F2Q70_00002242 [Brassica cretica]
MLPVACVATHGRPHVLMHDSFTCQMTAPRPDGLLHGWSACVATHRPLRVDSHAQIAGIATPRATTCKAACSATMHVYTSSFCSHSAADMLDRTSWPYA